MRGRQMSPTDLQPERRALVDADLQQKSEIGMVSGGVGRLQQRLGFQLY